MSDEQPVPVRVNIFGEEYAIRSDMGEEYTRACASYVDEAIQLAHVQGHVPELQKAAILAALQITDELFRGNTAHSAQTQMVVDRLSALRERVEAVLGD